MKSFAAAALGAAVLAIGLSSFTVPASALGACGPNSHRSPSGRCVFGGQNQAWCARHTGHAAGYGAYGTRWCR